MGKADAGVWAAIVDGTDEAERAAYEAVAEAMGGAMAYVEDTGGGVLAVIVDAAYGMSVYCTAEPEDEGVWLVGAHDEDGVVGTTLARPASDDARDTADALAHAVGRFDA